MTPDNKLTLVFGYSGKKHCGKSTAAHHLEMKLAQQGHLVARLSFATPIKTDIAALDPRALDPEWKERFRPLFQHWGSLAKELNGRDYWLNKWAEAWNDYKAKGYTAVIVDDVRFPFEADFLRSIGGKVIRILRPDTDSNTDLHESEVMIDKITPDQVIVNKGLEDFLHQV